MMSGQPRLPRHRSRSCPLHVKRASTMNSSSAIGTNSGALAKGSPQGSSEELVLLVGALRFRHGSGFRAVLAVGRRCTKTRAVNLPTPPTASTEAQTRRCRFGIRYFRVPPSTSSATKLCLEGFFQSHFAKALGLLTSAAGGPGTIAAKMQLSGLVGVF